MKKQKMHSIFFDQKYRTNFNADYDLMLTDIENGKFNLSMTDYVQKYSDILDTTTCSNLVKKIDNNPNTLHFADDLSTLLRQGTFINTYIPNTEFNEYVRDIVENVVSTVSKKYIEDVRPLYYAYGDVYNHFDYHVLKYDKNDYFKLHHDHYAETLNYSRLFTISLYLNEDYEGGEIEFPCINKSFTPKAGEVIVFPSNWMFYHGVNKITSGNRYAIIIWVGIDLSKHSVEYTFRT